MLLNQKAAQRAINPQNIGHFSEKEAAAKQMKLVQSSYSDPEQGLIAKLFLLVDESDGVIADSRFCAFGPPVWIAALDSACEALLRKNYYQAKRLSVDVIDKQLQGREKKASFPVEAAPLLNRILEMIDEAADQCLDIPILDTYIAPPEMGSLEQTEYPGFETLSNAQKEQVIAQVIEAEVQPYVELDAGGVTVQSVKGYQVSIAYAGNCTSCFSATGATLEAIQRILQARVHPDLIVHPDLSLLTSG